MSVSLLQACTKVGIGAFQSIFWYSLSVPNICIFENNREFNEHYDEVIKVHKSFWSEISETIWIFSLSLFMLSFLVRVWSMNTTVSQPNQYKVQSWFLGFKRLLRPKVDINA